MTADADLVRALEEGNLVLCVGPGPSLAAGLPDHDALARAIVDWAAASDPSINPAELGAWIDQGRGPEVLELLHHRLGAEFERGVEQLLSDQGRPPPPIARSIAGLRQRLRAIYTTRLDRLIERALAGRWPSFSTARPDLAQRRSLVFKLRGTLEFHQSWVLTREQEDREFGPGSPTRAVFEATFRAHELLLIGFDANSHELRRLLDMMPTGTDGHGPSHFIALPECGALEREQLERRGLRVLTVDGLELLDTLGGQLGGEARPAPSAATCPYPGLEAFTEDQASLFYGRHAEVSQAASLLGGVEGTDNRWLAIEGPSGVGKSSFARAGVIPALRQGFAEGTPARWRVATTRPGTSPLANLVTAVCAALGLTDVGQQLDQLRASPRHLSELIRRSLPPGEGMLLLVDQLEEIVTIAPEGERTPFGEAITRALDGRVLYLVTTTRSDLVPALQRGLPSLAGLLNELAQRYALPPISRVGLREAICEPAAKAGVTIAPDLVERVLVDADQGQHQAGDDETRTADATLPLVAHVLRGLWTDENVADGIITLDEYLAHGGVAGALSRSADELVGCLGEREQGSARELLLRLIRLQPDGTATRRVVELAEATQVSDEHVIGVLSGARVSQTGAPSARLLVVRDDHGAHGVELVHEALIRDWDTLRAWIEQSRAQLLLDEDLAREAAKWQTRGSGSKDLPRGRDMVELLLARPHGSPDQQRQQREFQAALQRTRRRRKWILGGVAAAAVTVSVGLFTMIEHDPETCSVTIQNGPKIRKAAVVRGSGDIELAKAFGQTTITYHCDANAEPLVTMRERSASAHQLAMVGLPALPIAWAAPPADEAFTVVVELDSGQIHHFASVSSDTQLEFADAEPGLPELSVKQLEQLGEIMPSPAVLVALGRAKSEAKAAGTGPNSEPDDTGQGQDSGHDESGQADSGGAPTAANDPGADAADATDGPGSDGLGGPDEVGGPDGPVAKPGPDPDEPGGFDPDPDPGPEPDPDGPGPDPDPDPDGGDPEPNDAPPPPIDPLNPALLGLWTFDSPDEQAPNWGPLLINESATVTGGELHVGLGGTAVVPDYSGPPIRDKTLIVWVTFVDPEPHGWVMGVMDAQFAAFDALLYTGTSWLAESNDALRTRDGGNAVEETPMAPVRLGIAYREHEGQAEVTICRDGLPIDQYVQGPLAEFRAGDALVVFGLEGDVSLVRIDAAFLYGGWMSCDAIAQVNAP